jgi:hypothetical protein
MSVESEDELRQALEDMVWQFAYRANDNTRKWLWTGGLSALEHAFATLGWDDPHYVVEGGCQIPGCAAWDVCGANTPDGYKNMCGEHGRKYF